MAPTSTLELRRPKARRQTALPERYRTRVLAALPGRVERIVLFGSRARGAVHADSDWDFAVFLDHEPSERDRERIKAIDWRLGGASRELIQSHIFGSARWFATDELACNIRDEGLIIHGSEHVPMVERPVLEHAHAALAKAERSAELAVETADERFEGVIHGAYYAMFHAARAVLLAVEGSASTKHGRVVDTFERLAGRQRFKTLRDHAAVLKAAYALRIEADYGSEDLTEAGRQLRVQAAAFLECCRKFVDQPTDQG